MLTFTVFFLSFFLSFTPRFLVPVFAQPLPSSTTASSSFCRITQFPFLCPRSPSTPIAGVKITDTSLGAAYGLLTESSVARYTVKYGSANRWGPSTVATTWRPSNGISNPTALPLACPQPNLNPSDFEEDCLSMILYVPATVAKGRLSTLMWIHGGSFIVGSATGPGLDGSKLATATNSIVAVVQYRLGALGFMSPDGTTNLAVKDLVTALSFLKTVIPNFGGDPSQITLAGQSSGATLIRSLLAVPSASSLFRSAIIQSDPMDFGFLKPSTQQELQTYFNSLLSCSSSDQSCRNALTLDTIINAQMDLFQNAVDIDESTGQAMPIRPVHDGSFITTTLDSTSPFPHVSKPLLISTVQNEAGPVIYTAFPDAVPESAFEAIANATFGTARTDTIIASANYRIPATGADDARVLLQTLGTDYMWRCPSWTFARSYVQNGGKAFVGLYTVGATYPGNDAIPFCTQPGSVCHQDDIEIVFGTVPNPTSAQAALTAQMQKSYKAFLSTGNPNVAGVPKWAPSTTTNVHALLLGGTGEAPVGACDPSFWGVAVQYDYQVFDI